ncbi:MAG: toxin-antitoxin system HicB family antitoxin [Ideonella sp. MAG2]|nr:MAG: toxin-antitoxin system HicB family antitoxin [Ideonella sp. MAG2]
MSTISVRLPDSLHSMAKALASQDNTSMNQFIASAVAEKVSALSTETYLRERAQRGSDRQFLAALDAVPAGKPEDFDQL